MDEHKSWLAPERPVDLAQDVLFRERAELWGRLEFLADHVAAAVKSPAPSTGSVFGISAPWGSGKSSALRVILDLMMRTLSADIPDLRKDSRGFLVGEEYLLSTSTFRANLHAVGSQSARLGLAYEVLQGFPGDYRKHLLDDLGYDSNKVGFSGPINSEIFLREKLREYADSGPVVEQWILDSFLAHRENIREQFDVSFTHKFSHVHVEFIDDLDRCSEAFTADVLAALSFWSAIPNLFFVVAADEEHLRRSAQAATELNERYSGEALEKFVHFQMRIPPLISGYRDAALFALHLFPEGELLNPGLRHLQSLLAEVGRDGPFGLMAPALRARTPRQAKRIFNELLQEFWVLRDLKGDSVKRIIARMVWPDAFDEYVFPVLVGGARSLEPDGTSPRADWLRILIRSAGEALEAHPHDIDAASGLLNELAKLQGVDLQTCPTDLLLYLGALPQLELADFGSPSGRRPGPIPRFAGLMETTTSSKQSAASSDDDTINQLIMDAEIAEGLGKTDELREICQRIAVVGRSDGLELANAARVGNLALRFERKDRQDLQLAWQLHQIAHQADPNHSNIRLNLVDFLLDHGGSDIEPLVAQHLEWLGLQDPEFKAVRRRVMRARLALRLREEVEGLDELITEAAKGKAYSNIRVDVLQILRGLQLFERIDELFKPWFEEEYQNGPEKLATALLASYAESLMSMQDPTAQARGADALRYTLGKGYILPDSGSARAVSTANLAIYLSNNQYMHAAAEMYRLAYEWEPQNSRIRSVYARFLLDYLEDPQNANAVQQGQELTIPTPTPKSIEQAFGDVPRYFSARPYWWEQYPLTAFVEPLTGLCS